MTNPMPNSMPRFVLYRGKRARIIGYDDGKFEIVDSRDLTRIVHRHQLTFIRNKKK